MKDDSLSDVQHSKTHYCPMCDTITNLPHDCKIPFPFPVQPTPLRQSVGKPDVIKAALAANKQQLNSWIREKENVYATEIWNEAIEAAAVEMEYHEFQISAGIIRRLKT